MIEARETCISGKLWPVHLKRHEDELLSSWLARLALAHGLRLKSLAWLVCPGGSVLARDIDLCKDPATIKTG
jgi:TniQ protein